MASLTTKHVLIVAAALIAAFGLHAYIGSRVATAQFDAITQEVKLQNKQIDDVRAGLDKQAADIARNRDVKVVAIERQKQEPASPEQLADLIAQRIPQTQVTKADLEKILAQLPNAPSAVKAGRDYILDCDECKVKLDASEKLGANKDQQIVGLESEKANLERNLIAAKKAANGGFWDKVRNCGARTGVGAAAGGLSGDGRKAGAGALIGFGSCFLVK